MKRLHLTVLLACVLAGLAAAVLRLDADDASAAGEDPGTWTQLAGTTFPRQEVAMSLAGGRLYLFGGTTDERQQVYDPAKEGQAGAWTDTADIGNPAGKLDHIQAVTLGTKIFYIGGLTSWPAASPNTPDGKAQWTAADTGLVRIYDTATDTWSSGADMPAGRERGGGGVAVFEGKIYYVGGIHDGDAVGWMDVYDPAANRWQSLSTDMPTARDHFQAVVVNGRLWAIGGRQGPTKISQPLSLVEAFNFRTAAWETGFAPIPTNRAGYGAAALGCEIVVIGGEGNGLSPQGTFAQAEAYDALTNTWRTLTPLPTARARHGIQAVALGNSVYIAGGGLNQGGGGATDDVDKLTFTPAACPTGTTTTGPGTTSTSTPATTAGTTPTTPTATTTTATCCSGETTPQTTPPSARTPVPDPTVGGAGQLADTTRPALSATKLSRTRFTIAGPPAKRGFVLRYRLSEPATMRLTVSRRSGTRAGRVKGSVTWNAKAGSGARRFRGRMDGRNLPTGHYVLSLTATDAAGNRSRAVRRSFTVSARKTT